MNDTLYTVLAPGAIQSVFEPEFYKSNEADSFYFLNEPLIVVSVSNQAKAYSTWYLDQHKVVNDYINDTAIIITWSPLCYTGIVYAASVKGKRLTFQASGSLWQEALVMMDIETESLWLQVTGECIEGPLLGEKLKLFHSSQTSYGKYINLYPDGLLLKKEEKGFQASIYDKYYFSGNSFGIFGRQYEFDRIPQKEIVFGLRLDMFNIAITKDLLIKEKFYIISQGRQKILVIFERESDSIGAFKIETDNVKITDKEIIAYGKRWNNLSGKPNGGKSKALEKIPITTAFWFAWKNFFPDTRLIYKK